MKYYARGFEVGTELARSVRKKRGLSISRYGTAIMLINGLLHGRNENIPNIQREFSDNIPKNYFSRN